MAPLTGISERTCLGEIVFADDTCLVGDAAEMQSAENILEQIMRDKEGTMQTPVPRKLKHT